MTNVGRISIFCLRSRRKYCGKSRKCWLPERGMNPVAMTIINPWKDPPSRRSNLGPPCLNPLPDDKILDWPKWEQIADDILDRPKLKKIADISKCI